MAAEDSRRLARKRPSTRATPTGDPAPGECPGIRWVPTRVFFTSGVGTHETRRVAMQRAMEEAGVADCNLIKVSSVIPPRCEIITREHGLRLLRPGNIVHAVIAQGSTDEPHQR